MKQREKINRTNTFFGFQARNEETDELRFLGFTLTIPEGYGDDVEKWINSLFDSDDFTDFVETQEMKYGVHDAYFGNWSIVYDSYEVEYNRLDALMEDWHNYFIELLGESNVGVVVELPFGVWGSESEEKIFEVLNEGK